MPDRKYTPFDQEEKLGPPPWDPLDEQLALWERAHGHDVRIKCYVEFGCLVVEGSAYDEGYADGREDLRRQVEAVLRLVAPDHLTPMGARQIRAVLDQDRAVAS